MTAASRLAFENTHGLERPNVFQGPFVAPNGLQDLCEVADISPARVDLCVGPGGALLWLRRARCGRWL
eukprot:12830894-Alexandrium_andersonii.AAC.1